MTELPASSSSPQQRWCPPLQSRTILGARVDALDYPTVCRIVLEWALRHESRYVCISTVNNVMEAFDSAEFRNINNSADLVTSDGMPLVWALRALGCKRATRVYGPDLTLLLLSVAETHGIPVGFFGASGETLEKLLARVRRDWPRLQVSYAWSPPFRPLTASEDLCITADIVTSGVQMLFVSLSTPKQDYWMAAHRGKIPAVMLGVGAAFDFIAGSKPQAPRWMMRCGLEWFFRLLTEPRRLWKRYLKQNPRFVLFFLLQWLGLRRFALPAVKPS